MQEKVPCAAPKYGKPVCENKIGISNKSGLCGRHFYLSRLVDPKADNRAKSKANGAAREALQTNGHATNGHASGHANGHALNGHAPVVSGRESPRVNVAISELQLDRLWVALTVEEKARLMFPPPPEIQEIPGEIEDARAH